VDLLTLLVQIEELDILKVFGKPFEGLEWKMLADRPSIAYQCTPTTTVGKPCGHIHCQMEPQKVTKGSMSRLPFLEPFCLVNMLLKVKTVEPFKVMSVGRNKANVPALKEGFENLVHMGHVKDSPWHAFYAQYNVVSLAVMKLH
jgi:hypothetical protein